ncbi:MAG: DUF5722 domain-containing protein [Lachnospiraceae bacterium]|nr:DUF5722 domain-containing protein [Lachnospiraceae bacterium]
MKILKKLAVSCMVAIMLIVLLPCNISGVFYSTKAAYTHTKATAEDVTVPNYYNKKGVQGQEVSEGPYAADLSTLNLNHILFNVDIAQVISTDGTGTPYTYKGNTYYFRDEQGSMMRVWEKMVKKYRDAGITMTFCIVLSWNGSDPVIEKLLYNPTPGKVYYAWNVNDPEARLQLEATMHYMTEFFGYSDTFVQNWRIGNEVSVSHDSNFTGAGTNGIPLESTLVDVAVKSYEILYEALKTENPYAKPFVSITHDWNYDNNGRGMRAKDFIDAFAKAVSDPNWNIDFHAYPPQMHEQVWTKNSAAYLSHDVLTQTVCGANLEVLTDYIKNNYGSNHRVILSEQSFDSKAGMEEQAAMIAYTYYAAARNEMVDNVIFTAWQDTNSVYHDYYDMGFVTIDGVKKPSYDVFQYMNTSEAATYVDPYLTKLSAWTGRTISSWSDDILYKAPATSAVMSAVFMVYPEEQQTPETVFIGLATTPSKDEVDLEYRWMAYDYTSEETTVLTAWKLNSEWLSWSPATNSTYKITCQVRVAGNPSSMMSASKDVTVNNPAHPASVGPDGDTSILGVFATYQGYTFERDANGDVHCYGPGHEVVRNEFKCDGKYTYFIQYDGTAMRDRLTYHPDGVHVIYFNQYGHEVFSNFAHITKTISGDTVDDYCFFNSLGYMYVDTLTYDKTGTKLYYINPYGLLEHSGWFQFSGKEFDAGLGFTGVPGGYGYAMPDGSLYTNAYTYDWLGRYCYLQGDGHAIY